MTAILIAVQGVLDVARYRAVDIFVRAFLGRKRRVAIVVHASHAHGAAVAQILVDAVDAQDTLEFCVRNPGGMQQDAPVIQLLVLREHEAQRVGTGQHHAHAQRREDIRKDRRPLNEVLHERRLVDEHTAVAVPLQYAQVMCHILHGGACNDLDDGSMRTLVRIHIGQRLAD